MSKYELMYIIDIAMDEGPRHELVERVNKLIADNGGQIDKCDEWGKRRLAYPINYKNEGYYVLINFSAGSELPREIERVLQISEDVLRYLIVKVEQKRSSVKPRAVPVRPMFARQPFENAPDANAEPTVETTAAPAAEAVVEAAVEVVADVTEKSADEAVTEPEA